MTRETEPGEFVDAVPIDALLAGLPDPMPAIAARLRSLVRGAVPEAIERVRRGWRVIGYDLPVARRRTVFFAWVMPQPEHVHLGFPRGVLLSDPDRMLGGVGEAKLARWLTATRPEDVDEDAYRRLTLEAAAFARTPGHYGLARLVAERGER